jgi:hypothetical protein
MVAEDDDPNIPTLTEVVKLGNPSLIISGASLHNPVPVEKVPDIQELATKADHAEIAEPADNERIDVQEEAESVQPNDYIALDLFEKADLEDEKAKDQPTMTLDIIKPIIEEEEEDDAGDAPSLEQVQPAPLEEEERSIESIEVATGIDLSSELADDFAPADTMTVDFDDLGIPTMLQAELGLIKTPDTETEAESAQEVGDNPPIEEHHDEIDPETVMMALEAPISGILQQHMQQARSEIQALIRQEIENQQKHLKH